jgi:hypothetical protein
VTAVADVPDAKHRLVVREHRRGRMRVIPARLWRSAGDDDLPLCVISEVDVLQRLALLLPKRLLFSRRGFPGTFRGLGGIRDFGLGLAEDGDGREQQRSEDEVGFHGCSTSRRLTPSSADSPASQT